MAQVKIYGLRSTMTQRRDAVSDAVHEALMESFGLPAEKRFQRFIMLDRNDFIHPTDRSENYTILEISCFEGRSIEAKRNLINSLFAKLDKNVGIAPQDVEITILETPQANWGIRGKPADELVLNYRVTV